MTTTQVLTTIYAIWHGGASYSWGDLDENVETFPSLEAAKRALRSRKDSGGWTKQTFHFADGRTEKVYTPCAEEDSTMLIYHSDPREAGDPYPDAELSFGPRGGVNVARM